MAENTSDIKTTLTADPTNLAVFRTALALDRTTLAWIRTGLTFVTFGTGMIAFFRSVVQATHTEQAVRLHQGAIHMGVALITLGMIAMILTAISHWLALRRLRCGQPLHVTQFPLAITIAVFVAVLCLCALWYAYTP